MTNKGKYILGGLAAASVCLAAAGAVAQRGHYWEGHKGRHFGHGGGGGIMSLAFGGPNHRMCRGDTAEMADHMIVRVEHRVKPTDDQKTAFDAFKTATRTAAEQLRAACPPRPEKTDGGERARSTPIERLALTQTGLEASLEALKTFRPAAEKFYAQLSDEQKAKLDRTGRGGKERGHWKRDRSPNDKDREPDNAAPDNKG